MDFKQELGALKIAIDAELKNQFDIAIKEARGNDIFVADCLKYAKEIVLAGGKRIRGALLCQAYFGAGGKEKNKILKIAAAIEMVHLFLLVHDDVIDRGNLRHGKKTLHRLLAEKKAAEASIEASIHYGDSVAIIVGEMLYAIANKTMAESGFKSDILVRTLSSLQSIVATTIIGQSQDLEISYKNNATEKKVLSMYENKTARYTIEGPLHLGAILAGCNDQKKLNSLSRYAIPLGIAFQIQDDILGIFGDEKKIGKSAASDIEEGKQSLLVVKARQWASPGQKKSFNAIFGKKRLSQKEINIFKSILKSTGAYDYVKDLAGKYLQAGKKEIKKIALLPKTKEFLLGLAEYLEGREI